MNFSANKNIESLNNPEYKFLVSLKKNRNRKSSNKSISEGFRECYKLLDSNYEIDTLYFCSDLFIGENNKDLLDECEQENIRIVKVSEKVFKAMSYRDRPDGFIAVFNTRELSLPDKINGPILIPDQIEKPGNLGTMIRTAKSFGINNIFLSDEITDIFNPNVIRASVGHVFNMNIWSSSNNKIRDFLNSNNYQILLLDPEGEESLENFKPENNFAVVVGAEQYGISNEWFENEYVALSIRSTNNVDSLNASTAAAIGMWELTK